MTKGLFTSSEKVATSCKALKEIILLIFIAPFTPSDAGRVVAIDATYKWVPYPFRKWQRSESV